MLTEKMTSSIFDLPGDAQQTVVDTWDHWRAWDLSHVKNSTAMRVIYGEEALSEYSEVDKEVPVDLSIRSGKTGFIIGLTPPNNTHIVLKNPEP